VQDNARLEALLDEVVVPGAPVDGDPPRLVILVCHAAFYRHAAVVHGAGACENPGVRTPIHA
jgi:hypothetical protein